MTNILFSPIQAWLENPATMLLIVPVAILAYVLDEWPTFPSKLTLPMCLANGMVLFPLLVPASTVKDYPNPLLVLALQGFILGFVAWLAHRAIVRRLVKWFHESARELDEDHGGAEAQKPKDKE